MRTSPIVFFGTPAFAVSSLKALHEQSSHEIALVVTQPDRPQGRGRKLSPTPIKEYCMENGLECIQPRKMKSKEFHQKLRETGSSLFIVAAYGRILPQALLDIPELVINVHASLLPRWRGAAPIARAIMNGDTVSGISIMEIVPELDAGPYFLQKSLEILPDETEGELRDRLASLGASLLIEGVDLLKNDDAQFIVQEESHVTFAPPVEKKEAQLNWHEEAQKIHNRIRGLNPNPGAYTLDGGKRVKIWKTSLSQTPDKKLELPGTLKIEQGRLFVACCDRYLNVLELQREGKGRQRSEQFISSLSKKELHSWGE